MDSLQGQLLIASPKLLDPNFRESVVLIVQHSEQGALGLVLNRPLDLTIDSAWAQIAEGDCFAEGHIHQGGPCQGPLMVVHTDREVSDMEVGTGLHFSTDRDSIKQLVAGNHCSMKFFVGYAGWGAGQLESEMEEGSWLVAEAGLERVFGETESLWGRLYREQMPSIFEKLKPKVMPEDPSTN